MQTLQENEVGALDACAKVMENGGVAALPTETVYGLMTPWASDIGRERIYEMKRRPASKRLQMLAPNLESAFGAGVADTPLLRKLAKRFWPGPLTIVAWNATHDDTIGLRIPAYPFVLQLLTRCQTVFAATSANLSGEPPATDMEHATTHLAALPDIAIDGGVITATEGKASTVIALLGDTPTLLREGAIRFHELVLCCQ